MLTIIIAKIYAIAIVLRYSCNTKTVYNIISILENRNYTQFRELHTILRRLCLDLT